MKLGVFAVLFQDKSFEEALDIVVNMGVEAIEIGTGAFPSDAHCKPDLLLKDKNALDKFKASIEKRNLFISALSCHGNPLHPDDSIARAHHEIFQKTVLLAEKLGVSRVVTFSGCPGGSENDKTPNWITCPWPTYFTDMLKWQWEKKIIPYWKEQAKFAGDSGVKICLEMHPGFSVYNTETLLRLRDAAGDAIGANLDPSHLFWQGIDPVAAVHKLGSAIYYVHAKDTKVNPLNSTINGVLDTKPYSKEIERSWIFRTVGYGHGYDFWKDFLSALRMVEYDYVLSIEHEDSLMSAREGLEKAVYFLKEVMLKENPGQMWWA